jgi:hypothetical protein
MTKPSQGGNAPKDTSAKPDKPGVKSDTMTQVTNQDSEKVKGGMRPKGQTTLNPTGSEGCCGGD